MKKIGILFGMETAFPEELVRRINAADKSGLTSEYASLGAITIDQKPDYDVVLDRISPRIPYYVAALKSAAVNGVRVVNNPFMNCFPDNFFFYNIAKKLDIPLPRTAILPSKHHPHGVTADFLRNLQYPLNWDEIFEYVGWPAYLKANSGSDEFNMYKIYNKSEFFSAYDLTGRNVMLLQQCVDYNDYFRCFAIGQRDYRVLHYDPSRPQHLRYKPEPLAEDHPVFAKIRDYSQKIAKAFDLDFNAVDFAVNGREVVAVDIYNPAPKLERGHLLDENFEWIADRTADMLIRRASSPAAEKKFYDKLIDMIR
ncbi:MAG: RimK family alpha-L-glutamate ligase [Candidatus Kapaibacterium sp.]